MKESMREVGSNLMTIATWNIHGRFDSKLAEINEWINKNEVDLMVVTETWVEQNKQIELENIIPGYVTYINSTNNRKHGIAIIIQERWNSYIDRVETIKKNRISKIVWRKETECPTIWGVYAPAGDDAKKEKFWNKMKEEATEGIIIGDMNLPLDNMGKQYQEELMNTWTDVWKLQHPDERGYTYWKEKIKTRIDTVLVTDGIIDQVKWVEIGDKEADVAPDHKPVWMILRIEDEVISEVEPVVEIESMIDLREVTESKKERYHNNMEQWELEDGTIDEMEEKIRNKIMTEGSNVFGCYFKQFNVQRKLKMSKELKKIRRIEKQLLKGRKAMSGWNEQVPKNIKVLKKVAKQWRPIINKDDKIETEQSIKMKHREIKQFMKDEVCRIKTEDLMKAIDECHERQWTNPRQFFNKITGKRQRQQGVTALQDEKGKIITDPIEIKEQTTEFFRNKFNAKTKMTEGKLEWWKSKHITEAKKQVERTSNKIMEVITEEEIIEGKKAMGSKKAAGTDKMPPELIKWTGNKFNKQLQKMFNAIIKEKKIPSKWHETIMHPIYKKGSRTDLNNYRPIAVTNVMYRLFMKILTNRLNVCVATSKLIQKQQAAFQKGRGTHERIWDMRHTYIDAKRRNNPLYTMFIDIAGAYDTVERWALQEALKNSGFADGFCKIIEDIYSNNYMEIMTVGGRTEQKAIPENIGVRQGCPMSPMLFIIFMNGLITWIDETCVGYVRQDKTRMAISGFVDDIAYTTGDQRELKTMANKTETFMNHYGMKLSIEDVESKVKTKTVITSNQPTCDIVYYKNGNRLVEIPRIGPGQSYKYLGIWMNMEGNWDEHWNKLYGKMIGYMNKMEKSCYSAAATVEVFNKIILSSIRYTTAAVFPDEEILNRIQGRINRMVYKKLRVQSKYNAAWRVHIEKEQGGLGLSNVIAEGMAHHWEYLLQETNKGNRYLQEVLQKQQKVFQEEKYNEWKLEQNGNEVMVGTYIERKKTRQLLLQQRVTLKDIKLKGGLDEKYQKGMTDKERKELRQEIANLCQQTWIMNELQEPIGETGDTIDIFTDAGKQNEEVIIGIHSPGRIDLGEKLFKNWKQSVQLGEIWAVLIALKWIRKEVDIRIFSDSLNTVEAIKNRRIRGKYGKITKKIIDLVDERASKGARTEIWHVYSHLNDGKKAEEKRQKQYKEMETRFGTEVQYVIEGNEAADALTQDEESKGGYCSKILEKGEWYFTWEGEVVERKEIVRKMVEKWTRQRPTYEEREQTMGVDGKLTRRWINMSGKNRDEITFAQTINIGKMPTRQRLNKKLEEGQIDLPMVYLWKHCPWHKEEVENEEHIVKCMETRKRCKNLPRKILKIINKEIREINQRTDANEKIETIGWFPPMYGDLTQQGGRQPRWEMWRGLTPKDLVIELKQRGITKKEAKQIAMKITTEVVKHMKKRWRIRCTTLYTEEENTTI